MDTAPRHRNIRETMASVSPSNSGSNKRWRSNLLAGGTSNNGNAAHDHDHAPPNSSTISISTSSEEAGQRVTPFLNKHAPQTYRLQKAQPSLASTMTSSQPTYCNRHRPDVKCWRRANEPSMEQLQNELACLDKSDQQGISHVWSIFSAAPARQRKLMLQGILAVCCFPQLSYLSTEVGDLIKIDFVAMLPAELSFKILCYLDTVSLCKAAQVSRKWNQLAEDDVVWHRMCEQHIAKKCKKCGWGLPLLDKKRLMKEKQAIKRRAAGIPIHDLQPTTTTSREVSEGPCDHSDNNNNNNNKNNNNKKRPLDESAEPSSAAKRMRTEPTTENVKRPWKEVYKTRFKVGSNWKYGRHSLKILKGHTNGIMCLQLWDNILATGSYDATIKIWDMDKGVEIRTLEGHGSGVRCLQLDECRLISGSMDETIKMWNWRTGECLRTLTGPTGDVLSVSYASNYLAAGGKDNMIRVWNSNDLSTFTLRGHRDFVNSVRIDAPSRTLFSAADDCVIRLWDLDTRRTIKTFTGHVGYVQQLLLLPPEFELDEVELQDCEHDTDTDHEIDEVINNDDQNDNDGDRSGLPGSFAAGDVTGSPPSSAPLSTEFHSSIFPDQPDRPLPPTYMLTASLDNTIKLWHVPSGKCLRTFFGHVEGVWTLAADNLRMISGAEDRTVKVWDPRNGKCERTFTGHAGPVTCVGLSGERLVSGSEDCEIRILEFSED